jgi:hypothetical protein
MSYDDIRVGDYAQIFSEKLETGMNYSLHRCLLSRNIVTVIHKNMHKTAARSSCVPCDPLFVYSWLS